MRIGRVTINAYDPWNRLIQTTDASLISTVFGYDKAGNRTSVTDANNGTTSFTYDGMNRMIVEQPPSAPPSISFYNQINKIAQQAADGKTTYFAYDARHRLITTTFPDTTTRTCSYDLAGNLLSVDESTSIERDVSYTYDSHNRVVTETSCQLTHTYVYDLAGNRVGVFYGRQGLRLRSQFDALNREDRRWIPRPVPMPDVTPPGV